MGLIIALLALWLVFVIVGFAVKALLWLAIVGIVLFIATGIYGAMQPHQLKRALPH
jgi:predicted cobalt transporter CbtA